MKIIDSNKINLLVLLMLVFFILSCNSQSPLKIADKISIKDSNVSACGGFKSAMKRAGSGIFLSPDDSTYCDAERLQWLYDENSMTLKVMNTRVSLNCCGEHEITVLNDNNVFVIKENDQPMKGKGRCRCMCVYDFYIEISGVSPGVITLKLEMTVDDTTLNKWEGSIDLGEVNGVIIIDNKPLAYGCP